MIVNYTDGFLHKLSIKHYPLKGFWFQLVNANGHESIKASWRKSGSDIYNSNTFVYDNKFRVSIRLTNKNDLNNKNNRLYLFAIDQLRYNDISELTSTSITTKNNELLTQLAAIIQLDHIPKWDINNIFELEVPYDIRCSFEPTSIEDDIQVSHYNSNSIGLTNYYKASSDDLLISKSSGDKYIREVMTRTKPDELLGTMTIKDNGLIQL